MKPLNVLAAAATLLASASVAAHGPGPAPRYQVDEIIAPAALQAPCLPGLHSNATSATVNDFGIVSGNFSCITHFNPDPAVEELNSAGGVFLGASWFPSIQLQQTGVSAFTSGVNTRGQAFGGDGSADGSAIHGVRVRAHLRRALLRVPQHFRRVGRQCALHRRMGPAQ
jgi:hypothetical protein